MRIVLIGQAAFAEKVLARFMERGEAVAGVLCPPDPIDKPGAIRQLADNSQIPVHQPLRMRDPSVFEALRRWQPDLIVMAFVTDIVPLKVLEFPPMGSIQYHPSLLPKHRGGSAINWAIVKGETTTGLTVFWPDQGIDTGPILLQKETAIGPDDTTGSLYFNRLFPLGVEALMESVDLVRAGRAPRVPQDEAAATYEPLFTETLAKVSWSRPVGEVYNLIRGANPSPGAVTSHRGQKLKMYDSEKVESRAGQVPGTVLEAGDRGIVVAAGGGAIRVKRVAPAGAGKIPAAEWAEGGGITVGEVLGIWTSGGVLAS